MKSRGASSKTAELLADLAALRGRPCVRCARAVCGHEAVMSMALGFKNGARCLACLAAALGEEVAALRDHVMQHIRRRECFSHGWLAASEHEGFGTTVHPPCLWPDREMDRGPRGQAGRVSVAQNGEVDAPADALAASAFPDAPWAGTLAASASAAIPAADAEWDAGDTRCGGLVLELRLRLRAMAPGSILKLITYDPGAPEDLPVWCGMTGHTLLAARHPEYWIKRREESHHDG